MENYEKERAWADKFTKQVKQIVGPLLLCESSEFQDTKEATDLIVFTARDMKIAMRVRRPGFSQNYGNQFTLRYKLASGAKTELAKIVEGFGDWFFYGHTDGDRISKWMVVDLTKLRAEFIRSTRLILDPDDVISGIMPNKDGSKFIWFDVSYMPKILVAKSD